MTADILSAGSADALPELVAEPNGGAKVLSISDVNDLALLIDVPLGTVEFDLRSFLELEVGSVLQTNRQTGESLEISVNGTPIAKGEVRIQGDHFAVRITEVLRAAPSRDSEGAQTHAKETPQTD